MNSYCSRYGGVQVDGQHHDPAVLTQDRTEPDSIK